MSGQTAIGDKDLAVVLSKAGSDPVFKARLLADGRAAIASLGITVADDLSVRFVEDAGRVRLIVTPTRRPDGDLTDGELDQVAGGFGPEVPLVPKQLGRGPKL